MSVVENATPSRQFSTEHSMTLTLLVDLDDTLLGNNMETFIPAYLNALGSYLAEIVQPDAMVKSMMGATQCMFANSRPDRTLKNSFDPCFYPTLGLIETEVQDFFGQFYERIFPSLEIKTQFRPQAVDFIDTAYSRGYQIGIATNPVFPLTAIKQRLEWAGLSPEKYPFLLIPSYETFHFTKPNPAYFAEFLCQIGWPDGPIVMVGNDPDHDVLGSQGIGIPVYWVSEDDGQFPEDQPIPNGSGYLKDFYSWLESQTQEAMNPDYSSKSALSAILRGSPAGLLNLITGVKDEDWSRKPATNAWSLTEIVCHLRDVEREINLPRINKIINEENPFIPGVDSDTWASEKEYILQDGPKAFDDFVSARIETMGNLDKMDDADWSRPVRHAIFGPTNLKEIIHIMAGHERLHGKQIYELI
jgi:FMN phosphatase YigB (HAD superfamily)